MIPAPIVLVTGANGGVGFGICHRLLLQLCHRVPPDSLFRPLSDAPASPKDVDMSPFFGCEGITLILGCRSSSRADAARKQMLALLDAEIEIIKAKEGYDGHAEVFRRGVNIDVLPLPLDLGCVGSVLDFADELKRRYAYISHIVLNAGGGTFCGIDWPLAVYQCLTEPITAVSRPRYKQQTPGVLSKDGFGWVWQCNVFGHYILVRRLEGLMKKSPCPARVLWMSSLEAEADCFDIDDEQLVNTSRPYEGTKYQADLLGRTLDSLFLASEPQKGRAIRHIVVHPGITATNILASQLNLVLTWLMLGAFYIARFLGSRDHPISTLNGAISASHGCLAPLSALPTSTHSHPLKLGSKTDIWGSPYVGVDNMDAFEEHANDGKELVRKMARLYVALLKKHRGDDEEEFLVEQEI